MDLFNLQATIQLETSDYERGISKIQSSADDAEDALEKVGEAADDAEDELDDLEDGADGAGDKVKGLGEKTENTDGKFSAWKVTLANLAANVITTAVSKIGDMAQAIYEVGTETETANAKLETIAGTENIDALTESITELSNETGVSSAELADVAYNAISAGASTEDAMEMVEAATKLGVAGFTDSSNALSVLSTVMNSYGDEAGTATEISDSLIQVQNLGVTTIDELSSSMGKAIATGSAYSVDLGNIESAYVSLTKAGISTEESTTYLNSMLNELGDSGSDVSGILQEQTGKSFTELMEDGYSLSDVLGILYDSCGNDSTALMNLWSSAEAGKASNAIVNQGLDEFNENLETITNSSGATEDAYAIMSDTMEVKMNRLKTSFGNLGVEIFNGLEEPLGKAIDVVIDYVIPGIETLINGIFAFGEGLVTAVETIANFVSNGVEKIRDFASNVKEKFSNAKENVSDFAENLAGNVTDKVSGFKDNATTAFDNFKTSASDKFKNVKSTVSDWGSKMKSDSSASTFANTAKTKFSSFKSNASSMFSSVTSTTKSWGSTTTSTGNTAMSGFVSAISSRVSSARSAASSVASAVSEKLSNLKSQAATWASDMMNNFINGIRSKASAVKSAASSVASSVKSVLGFSLPEEGPLSDADTYMPDFMALLAKGISDNSGEVVDKATSLADAVSSTLNGDYTSSIAASTSLASSSNSTGSTSANFTQLFALLQEYLPKLANMQMVTDTGALVGSIVAPMDKALGKLATAKERGR